MTNTKKSFITAGTIIGIVEAAIMIITSFITFGSIGLIDADFVFSTLEAEEQAVITTTELSAIVDLSKIILVVMGIYILLVAIAMLVMSIIVLKQKNKGICKKGPVIALLVLSALNGNILTAAFMIVVLCLKDKTAKEIVEENMPQ